MFRQLNDCAMQIALLLKYRVIGKGDCHVAIHLLVVAQRDTQCLYNGMTLFQEEGNQICV